MIVANKNIPNRYRGADVHVSTDRTTNPQPYPNSQPVTEDEKNYPKYLYHKEKGAKVVASKEEQDALEEGYQDTPHQEAAQTFIPAGLDGEGFDAMTRSDLAEYGNRNFGLQLKGTQSRDELMQAIRTSIAERAGVASDLGLTSDAPEGEKEGN